MKKLAIHAIAVLLCVVLSAGALHAQAVYGSIVGTVADSSGAVLAGAKITITDVGRDVTTITTTNESGNYTQRALIVGKYRLRLEAPGFQTGSRSRQRRSLPRITRRNSVWPALVS